MTYNSFIKYLHLLMSNTTLDSPVVIASKNRPYPFMKSILIYPLTYRELRERASALLSSLLQVKNGSDKEIKILKELINSIDQIGNRSSNNNNSNNNNNNSNSNNINKLYNYASYSDILYRLFDPYKPLYIIPYKVRADIIALRNLISALVQNYSIQMLVPNLSVQYDNELMRSYIACLVSKKRGIIISKYRALRSIMYKGNRDESQEDLNVNVNVNVDEFDYIVNDILESMKSEKRKEYRRIRSLIKFGLYKEKERGKEEEPIEILYIPLHIILDTEIFTTPSIMLELQSSYQQRPPYYVDYMMPIRIRYKGLLYQFLVHVIN